MERKQLHHLTGFRAIAAYLVLICHSVSTTFIYGGSNFAPVYAGCLAYLGMSIFFVLSGFVITYTYFDRFIQLSWRQAAWNFTVARFARLYPLYILFLLWERRQWKPLFRHGTFAEIFSYFTLTQSWWNVQNLTFAPAWSISTECFFYVCFALWMLPGITRYSGAYIQRKAIVTVVGILAILAAVFTARIDITAFLTLMLSRVSNRDVWGWFQYFSPYVRVGEFIAGGCAARMFMATRHEERLPAHQHLATMLCIGSGVAIITVMIGTAWGMIRATGWFASDSLLYFLGHNFGYAPFLAYIFYACSRYPNLLTKLCSTLLMRTGGEISYSVYILQFWVYSHVIPEPVAEWPSRLAYEISSLKALLYIILTTAVSLCSYHILEVPSRCFFRKWLSVRNAKLPPCVIQRCMSNP